MGPNDPARRLQALLSVVIAAGMDHAGGRTRPRGRFRQRRQADHLFPGSAADDRRNRQHSRGESLPASLSCPTCCRWTGAGAFEPLEHRPSDKRAGSALLRPVRADGLRRIAAGIPRDLHPTRPQAEVGPHLSVTVLENFTFVSAKRQFIISWIGIFLTFLAGGLISSKLLMVAVA